MRFVSLAVFCVLVSVTLGMAQEAGNSAPLDDATQLKVDALGFMQSQRNTALDSLVGCQADSGRKIDRLTKENAALKQQLAQQSAK